MDLELPVDPNEPTYCFCNQVSYGEMVACDNNDVCNPFLSFSFFLLNFSSTFLIYDLMKASVTLSTVQNRMVPLWLCWSEGAAKREMVLFRLCCAEKSSERKMMLGSYFWALLFAFAIPYYEIEFFFFFFFSLDLCIFNFIFFILFIFAITAYAFGLV